MLLANRTVAERIADATRRDIQPPLRHEGKAPTFVYRVHEAPDEEKLHSLADFVRPFGYQLRWQGGGDAVAKSLNELLAAIKGRPEEAMISMLALYDDPHRALRPGLRELYALHLADPPLPRPHGAPPPDALPHRGQA